MYKGFFIVDPCPVISSSAFFLICVHMSSLSVFIFILCLYLFFVCVHIYSLYVFIFVLCMCIFYLFLFFI